MSDALLGHAAQEEALSRAYVSAVAAAAGYMVAEPQPDLDGTDLIIKAGGSMRPSLEIQLKATINLGVAKGGAFRYPLPKRNYDLLRVPTLVPSILVVLSLPTDMAEWLTITPESLIMRRCAFWASLKALPESNNTSSVTVSIQENNRFDKDGLIALMAQARTGAIL